MKGMDLLRVSMDEKTKSTHPIMGTFDHWEQWSASGIEVNPVARLNFELYNQCLTE
jgi:hypothetical protein